jgi:hypothetical protein
MPIYDNSLAGPHPLACLRAWTERVFYNVFWINVEKQENPAAEINDGMKR